ncbi:hypothetical protein JTB14_036787 [Gonioctena quinquepunctata]|nr:hypothetical protein JTB14_036787 [Gonioctena quinquepunctata]
MFSQFTDFPNEAVKNTHVGYHFGKVAVCCRVCGRQFNKKHHYLAHYGTHPEKKYPFTCTICYEIFSLEENLQKHQSTFHGKRLLETLSGNDYRLCSEESPIRSHHESVDSEKKTHQCSVCMKSCATVADLNEHMGIHSDPKSFECPVCSRQFTQMGAMMAHQAAVHAKKKTFRCTQCPQTFAYNSSYRRHLRIHKDDAPFEC